MFKKYVAIVPIALITLAMLGASPVMAHGGAVAKHGGIAQMASDLSFELVPGPEGVVIYVEDHGQPLAPTGMSGKLTILTGSEKTEAPLVVAGDKLEAKGVKLGKGSKVVASLKTAQQKSITVRFSVR
ncbi:MAG: hypothetical protein Q8J96_10755 [Rhodocyclaceae bacterium]|nr:hypothetical protein [Rhodocyclaceae bacterium]MDP3030513.1 hypothetical protein [Rhodocyclaceae bacterium]